SVAHWPAAAQRPVSKLQVLGEHWMSSVQPAHAPAVQTRPPTHSNVCVQGEPISPTPPPPPPAAASAGSMQRNSWHTHAGPPAGPLPTHSASVLQFWHEPSTQVSPSSCLQCLSFLHAG